MDNKLSELSKPVAWASQRHIDTRHRIEAFTDEESANGTRWVKVAPLYSQEYVSALLAELEAKDKRIAELESIRADASQVFKQIGNELGCNPDNESIMMAIYALKERERRVVALANGNDELWEAVSHRLKTLEDKLAMPVRLPQRYEISLYDDIDWDPDPNGDSFKCDEVINMLREQGFTVGEE